MQKLKFPLKSIAVVSVLLICIHCANQVGPSGGPDDKTGPMLVGTNPPSGSLKINPTQEIRFVFNEWISPSNVQKSVAIYPVLKKGFRVKVSRRTLIITPRERFADSTTYHVIVTSSLQDLRGNGVTTPINLVFSTGATLDSGVVEGCVHDPSKRHFLPKTALFRINESFKDSLLFSFPDYVVQADSNGHFLFENIRTGQYKIIAFTDENNDSRITPGIEKVYTTPSKTIDIQNKRDTNNLLLFLHQSSLDTTLPRLGQINPLSGKVIYAQWRNKIDTTVITGLTYSIEQIEPSISKVPIRTVIVLPSQDRFFIEMQNPMSASPYRLIASFKTQRYDSLFTIFDTLRFNGNPTFIDTVKPKFLQWLPGGIVDLHDEIKLVWNKPIRLQSTQLFAYDTLGDTIAFRADSTWNDSTTLTHMKAFRPGKTYKLKIGKSVVKDIFGQMARAIDTVDTFAASLQIRVIHPDSIATSLDGSADCLPKDNLRRWIFKPLNRQKTYEVPEKNGIFRFDSIIASKGTFAYYRDLNQNGRFDQGKIIPWIPTEPYTQLYDTVEARANWDIEGVLLKSSCVNCKPKIVKDSLQDTLKRSTNQNKK